MKTQKILVIDDEMGLRGLVMTVLRRDGYSQLFEAGDGEEGIRMINEHRPDLVITDLTMPKKDGIEVILWICQSHKPNHPIKIIAVSGHYPVSSEWSSLEQMVKAVGANAFLDKPFTGAVLKKTVEAVLIEA